MVNRGDAAIFNLGREAEHHGVIWRMLQAHSGIAIVHDAHLHELYAHAPAPVYGERTSYPAECERVYGTPGRLAAEIFRAGLCSAESMAETFPMLDLVLEASSGVLVHDPQLASALTRPIGPPVAYVPHPLAAGADPEEFLRAFFALVDRADSSYARSMMMARRTAAASKGLTAAGADAICDLAGK